MTEALFIVCGGRDYADYEKVCEVLNGYYARYNQFRIIEGEASGADRLAKRWALEHGVQYSPFPADWKRHGKKAGFIRNQQMLDCLMQFIMEKSANDDVDYKVGCIAFPGGNGTADMVRRCINANIDVEEVK